jgi:hypothetical protein
MGLISLLVNNIEHTEMHITEPLIPALSCAEVEIALEKLELVL